MHRFRSVIAFPLLLSWLGASAFAEVGAADREEDAAGGELVGVWQAAGDTRVSVPMRVHREQQGEGRVSMRLGAEGERFVGEFLRISDLLAGARAEARVERLYLGWTSNAYDDLRVGPLGRPWIREEYTLETFRRRHRGAVVATLIGDRGGRMRCRFDLVDVRAGLPGGANGRCQTSRGEFVDFGTGP